METAQENINNGGLPTVLDKLKIYTENLETFHNQDRVPTRCYKHDVDENVYNIYNIIILLNINFIGQELACELG